MSHQEPLTQLVNQYQYGLFDLPGFDPVPLEWLHLLLSEVGFSDEIDEEQINDLITEARAQLDQLAPVELSVGQAVVYPESIVLPAEPAAALTELRMTLRNTAARVLPQQPEELPEADRHLHIAYSTAEGPAAFARARLAATPITPVSIVVDRVHLVRLNRDHASNEWEVLTELPLNG